MRRTTRTLLLVAGLVLPTFAFPAVARVGAVTAGTTRFAPTTIPAGWYLWGATAPAPGDVPGGGFTFYARRDAPTKGPALAVGTMTRDDFAGLTDRSPRSVAGLPGGRLARNGDFVWVTWRAPGDEGVRVVATRGVSAVAVIAAARGARFPSAGSPSGAAPSITPSARPAGTTRLVANAGMSPDDSYPAEEIVLVDRSGAARIDLGVFEADAAETAFARFWADQVARRGDGGASPKRAVMAVRDGAVLVARGAATDDLLRSLVDATGLTDAGGWEGFRARVAELPVAAFFPQLGQANGAVLDGADAGTRWAVGWDRGAAAPHAWNMLVTPDGTQGGGGTGLPDTGLPDVASSGTILGHGGMLFAGVVPATAAVARFEPPGRPAVDATIGPLTPDGAHRYFAAWVPGLDGTSPLVVLDAPGNEIARRAQFGCNTCD